MTPLFKLLGVLLLVYVGYAIWRGEVFAKSGAWGTIHVRDASPHAFWGVIIVYSLLGLALLTIF